MCMSQERTTKFPVTLVTRVPSTDRKGFGYNPCLMINLFYVKLSSKIHFMSGLPSDRSNIYRRCFKCE